MKKILTTLTVMFVLLGCTNKQSDKITSSNSSETLEISVSAKQTVMFDPWLATITVHNKKSGSHYSVEQELVIDDLNSSNVDFDWVSENKCLIKFTEKNGEVKSVPVIVQLQ